MEYKRIGIDTSKAVFTVHGIDASDRPTLRRNLKRAEFEKVFAKLAPTDIALEACGSSHHWARTLAALGQQDGPHSVGHDDERRGLANAKGCLSRSLAPRV